MKPLIGIVGQYYLWNEDSLFSKRYYFLNNYAKVVDKAGAIPLGILPIDLDIQKENLAIYNGFILCGGTNVSDYHLKIIDYALLNNVPLLGICCGMQAIAMYLNKRLIPCLNHYNLNHQIYLDKNSYLYDIFQKDCILVNSYHNYQVENLKGSAYSEDNVLEAIEIIDDKHFILGMAWHPELLADNFRLFENFIKKCDENVYSKRKIR